MGSDFTRLDFNGGIELLDHDVIPSRVDDAREQVLKACRMLVEQGLVARTWGNVSVRISDDLFAITPSGREYSTLTPDQIVVVRATDGTWFGDIKPSSEKFLHSYIYLDRPDVNVIVHTHQFYASAISVLGLDVENTGDVSQEAAAAMGGTVPCAEYAMSSTEKLAEKVRAAFSRNPDAKALLMKNHGAVCVGGDVDSAFRCARLLEEISEEIYSQYCLGDVAAQQVEDDKVYFLGDPSTPRWARRIMTDDKKCVVVSRKPYTVKMSRLGKEMGAYIDDLAQIGGTSIKCVLPTGKVSELSDAIRRRDAVLVKGRGAVCRGADEDEAEALATVMEKGCAAAHLAESFGGVKPVKPQAAFAERAVYVTKYSKLRRK